MEKSIISKIRKGPVKYFIFKFLVFALIIFSFDFIIGRTLQFFYFRQESGLLYRATFSMEKTRANVLVFGSSRANHHYHPDVFEKKMKMTFYNVGRDGNFILYHYAILKSVLKRYQPKVIILDFNKEEFKVNQECYDRLSTLLPYYRSHKEIRPIINMRGPFEQIKNISSIYPYNSSLLTIAIGNTEYNKKRKTDIKGYVPLFDKMYEGVKIHSCINYKLDCLKIKTYENFIRECLKNKIKIYIVHSPSLIKFSGEDLSIKIGQGIAKKYNIPFYNFSNLDAFTNNSQLFSDFTHLNNDGAKLFSTTLTKIILSTEF